MKTVILILFVASVGTSSVIGEVQEDAVTVSLYYGTFCPECMWYVSHELYSAWTRFKGHVLFDLVPCGKSRADEVHACATYLSCGHPGTSACAVDRLGPAMDFINCLVQQPDQLRATKPCAKSAGLDGDAILSCSKEPQGAWLLNFYRNRTDAFRPKIKYVPTVAINGKLDEEAREDLVGKICKLLPKLC